MRIRADGGVLSSCALLARRSCDELMPSAADIFSMLHLGFLAVFVLGTAVLLLVAIVSRLRVQRPLLVWHVGPLTRIPIGPSLFLMLVALGLGWASMSGQPVPLSAVIGYPAGGLFWFVATWLVRTVVVTEYGLVPDVLRVRGAIAWSQVFDYVSTSRKGRPHFVFYYRSRRGEEKCSLDLTVPERHVDEFRELVKAKLEVRPAFSDRDVVLADVGGRN